MTFLSDDLAIALKTERDFRGLGELDITLITRVRNRIQELGVDECHERWSLVDLLTDLLVLRIEKITRLAYRDLTENRDPDMNCAQQEEIELYEAIRGSIARCAERLGVDLRSDGE